MLTVPYRHLYFIIAPKKACALPPKFWHICIFPPRQANAKNAKEPNFSKRTATAKNDRSMHMLRQLIKANNCDHIQNDHSAQDYHYKMTKTCEMSKALTTNDHRTYTTQFQIRLMNKTQRFYIMSNSMTNNTQKKEKRKRGLRPLFPFLNCINFPAIPHPKVFLLPIKL